MLEENKMDSILITIKQMLLGNEADSAFDNDLIPLINMAFYSLYELGLGVDAFVITGDTEVWSDFCSEISKYEALKTYVYIKVKLLFDPPTSSFVLDAFRTQLSELEFRLLSKKEVDDYKNSLEGGEIQNGV